MKERYEKIASYSISDTEKQFIGERGKHFIRTKSQKYYTPDNYKLFQQMIGKHS